MEIVEIIKFDGRMFQLIVMGIAIIIASWAIISMLLKAIDKRIVYGMVIISSLIVGAAGNGFPMFWMSLMFLSFIFLIATKTNKKLN